MGSPRDQEVVAERSSASRINARTVIGDDRSTNLRAGKHFDESVAHFGADQVKAIEGKWHFGTNLDKYNELLRAGKTREDAAQGTWTGEKAEQHGFTNPKIDRDDGPYGNHDKVEVTFRRPG